MDIIVAALLVIVSLVFVGIAMDAPRDTGAILRALLLKFAAERFP